MIKPLSGSLTISGGRWRGHKLNVIDAQGLRPTPARIRETLFNWLRPFINGVHCLDLFAGSGALGFGALSEGAGKVTMVDSNADIIRHLHHQSHHVFKATNCQIIHHTAAEFLNSNRLKFDIVFIDPPYNMNLWAYTAQQLVETGALSNHARIYLECPVKMPPQALPANWRLLKDQRAGQIRYCLFSNQGRALA